MSMKIRNEDRESVKNFLESCKLPKDLIERLMRKHCQVGMFMNASQLAEDFSTSGRRFDCEVIASGKWEFITLGDNWCENGGQGGPYHGVAGTIDWSIPSGSYTVTGIEIDSEGEYPFRTLDKHEWNVNSESFQANGILNYSEMAVAWHEEIHEGGTGIDWESIWMKKKLIAWMLQEHVFPTFEI